MEMAERVIRFSFAEIERFTEGFKAYNIFVEGTFGFVYKGVISGRDEARLNGRVIAVKMSKNSIFANDFEI
ncbi:hypothetical protein COLO4_09977 [Corchorus olitorius]|uniref:Protein kinase domain-containing protein n=1 Tax=Corchorus olitorius TaxID=93759 RepID=A0A1R3KAJ6_9ROSI|nr:hypothetical protein COLO4_09977 [Corchorus olitorius]